MTCIVGMIDKKTKKVIIGGDSSSGNGSNIFIRKDVKVFKNKDFVIGCTSSFRMIQLLRFSFNPPEIKVDDVYQYMCTDFINGVRDCFKNGGYLQKYTDGGDERGGTFIVGYKNRLFEVGEDFQVAENLNGMHACGCGADFALGTLFTLQKQEISTESKVLKSLESAEFLSSGVRRPFILIST